MGRKISNLSPAQRHLIYELKRGGKSGAAIQETCAAGYKEFPPFSVSPSRANEIAREVADERGELYDSELAKRPAHEVTAKLARRLIHIADRESSRLDKAQRQGKLNSRQLGDLASAVTRLHSLLERVQPDGEGEERQPPPGEPQSEEGGEQRESSFVSKLIADQDETPPPEPSPPTDSTLAAAPIADVAVGANGGSFARLDRRPDAAPQP